jgi:ribosomal protein S18 acetylase RimI-like enzyme
MTPQFGRDRSDAVEVLRHLKDCDAAFHPPLSLRVDLTAYAMKLATQAARFEAWQGEDLLGLVAVYCNAPDRKMAFVSNVSVRPDCAGQGIASQLMTQAIAYVRALGFAALSLEVSQDATRARRFYTGLGFAEGGPGQDGAPRRMVLPLR